MGLAPAGRALTITDRLRFEHRILRGLLDRMDEALKLPPEEATALAAVSLKALLAVQGPHERVEEEVLFPAANLELTADLKETHRRFGLALAVCRDALRRSPRTVAAAAEQLSALHKEHMAHEESVLFARVEASLDRETLVALAERAGRLV